MTRRISFSLLAAVIIMLAACSTQKPIGYGNITHMDAGITGSVTYYSLPRSVISIDVEVTMTTSTPGPYAQFAEMYLGLNRVIFDPATTYEISGVSINNFSEPDPDHMYYVTLPASEENQMYISLTRAGLISSVNTRPEIEDPKTEINDSKDYGRFGTDTTFNYFIDSNLKEQIDTIVEHVRMDTITVQRQTLRRSWVEKSTELRAREVADYILQIREKKFDLISGFQEINYSREALEYMYSEMDKLESDYLDLFTGITSTQTIRYRFVHTPSKANAHQRHALFRFSTREGVLPAGQQDEGIPVSISYIRSEATDLLEHQIVRHNLENQAPGFYYRIPEYADLIMRIGNEIRAEARVLVNQFGVVTYLPPHKLEIEYYPGTGSIKRVGNLPAEQD